MTSIRRHLTYANVLATLAVFFAMSGGALAAKHFLLNSTKQISPAVLKKLKGNAGKKGSTGAQGAKGETGATGPTGAKGETGPKGEAGLSALASLPSGATESGDYGTSESNVTTAKLMSSTSTFPVPLAERAEISNVIYNKLGETSTHCAGPGQAGRGFVCIYSEREGGVAFDDVQDLEGTPVKGTGVHGFVLFLKITGATGTEAFEFGTYTVTAG
jgi:hypothetical protein